MLLFTGIAQVKGGGGSNCITDIVRYGANNLKMCPRTPAAGERDLNWGSSTSKSSFTQCLLAYQRAQNRTNLPKCPRECSEEIMVLSGLLPTRLSRVPSMLVLHREGTPPESTLGSTPESTVISESAHGGALRGFPVLGSLARRHTLKYMSAWPSWCQRNGSELRGLLHRSASLAKLYRKSLTKLYRKHFTRRLFSSE